MPSNDVIHEITAVFGSAEEAQLAQAAIEDQRMAARDQMRISAERVLHVRCAQPDIARVADALRSAGATGLQYNERQRDSGWMGHHNEQVTGSGVAPGQGDAEAGS